MFGSLGGGEILLLVLVGLIVFGPERLPTIARDAAKVLRQLRQMATSARDEISSELGPEVADLDLRSLNPRALVQKHLFGDDDESLPAMDRSAPTRAVQDERGHDPVSMTKPDGTGGSAGGTSSTGSTPTPYDADAT